jgi:hypothetical protein
MSWPRLFRAAGDRRSNTSVPWAALEALKGPVTRDRGRQVDGALAAPSDQLDVAGNPVLQLALRQRAHLGRRRLAILEQDQGGDATDRKLIG